MALIVRKNRRKKYEYSIPKQMPDFSVFSRSSEISYCPELIGRSLIKSVTFEVGGEVWDHQKIEPTPFSDKLYHLGKEFKYSSLDELLSLSLDISLEQMIHPDSVTKKASNYVNLLINDWTIPFYKDSIPAIQIQNTSYKFRNIQTNDFLKIRKSYYSEKIKYIKFKKLLKKIVSWRALRNSEKYFRELWNLPYRKLFVLEVIKFVDILFVDYGEYCAWFKEKIELIQEKQDKLKQILLIKFSDPAKYILEYNICKP